MTKNEYLNELASHLISLPKEERDMAIRFYDEYFMDAGEENEQIVMAELGKPFNLAKNIIGEQSAYSKSEEFLRYKESKAQQEAASIFANAKGFENKK
jgi:uncharacterized membrane protein